MKWSLAGAVVAVAGAVGLLRSRSLVVVVRGQGMAPALNAGDRVLVLRRGPAWRPRRGSLVAFSPPDGRLHGGGARGLVVRRVVAVPGDRMPGRAGVVVPEGTVYLLGDAPEGGTDSRHYGPVSWPDVVGVVIRRKR